MRQSSHSGAPKPARCSPLFLAFSVQAPLAEGDVEELRRMCWITTTRILRAASNGLQATLRLVSTLDLESKWKHASHDSTAFIAAVQLRAQLYFQAVPHREKVDKFYPEVPCEGDLHSIPNLPFRGSTLSVFTFIYMYAGGAMADAVQAVDH